MEYKLFQLYPRPDQVLNRVTMKDPEAICSSCMYFKASGAADIVIPEIPDSPWIPCEMISRVVAHRDLLVDFGKVVLATELMLGRVFLPNGIEVKEFAAVYGRHLLVTHSSRGLMHKICEKCGRLITGGQQAPYYSRKCVIDGVQCYESNESSIVVTNVIVDRLSKGWRRHIDPIAVPIRDGSLDGLPEDIAVYPRPEQLASYQPHWPVHEPFWKKLQREK